MIVRADKQLSVLHSTCLFRLTTDIELSYEDEDALHTMVDQLEYLSPQLAEQPEAENEDENELSEEV